MIQPVKNLHGLSPIEDWIQHSQWLEQERDKYRDACERLIGHYGDSNIWRIASDVSLGFADWYMPERCNAFDFARQVKAEIEAGRAGPQEQVEVS